MSDNRLIPRPIIHRHEEFPEHKWIKKKTGEIDMSAMDPDYEFHNGPACERCGYSFCEHCDPKGWDREPCVIDEYHCPNCNYLIEEEDKFCRNCGQAILQEDKIE